MAVRVTSRGRVTIPKRIRELLDIRPGCAVEFHVDPDGRVVLRRVGRPPRVKNRFAGCRDTATVRMRTEEIMALTRGEA
jgi:AbrB family looped-hinge helix DNA binding protein